MNDVYITSNYEGVVIGNPYINCSKHGKVETFIQKTKEKKGYCFECIVELFKANGIEELDVK